MLTLNSPPSSRGEKCVPCCSFDFTISLLMSLCRYQVTSWRNFWVDLRRVLGSLHTGSIGYAGVLTSGPSGSLPTVASTFLSVFIGATLLSKFRPYTTSPSVAYRLSRTVGSIAAFTDTGNNPGTPGFTPLPLGLVMVGIASSL